MPKSKRPSPDDRKRKRLILRVTKTIDKKQRTRAATKVKKHLDALAEHHPEILDQMLQDAANNPRNPPSKLATGVKIYSGKGRSFEKDFAADFWDKHKLPCKCAICDEDITADGKNDKAKSIDHKIPWATVKIGLETSMVCKNGQHWEVVFQHVMRAAYQDDKNLQPAHKGCNSKKNGPKDSDSIAPQPRGLCGLDPCDVSKAT